MTPDDNRMPSAKPPEPLIPDGGGFGSCQELGVVIPWLLNDEPVTCTAMMFLNDEPPIPAGCKIWGFPKRWGDPKLEVRTDTLSGTLHCAGERVAMGTMAGKNQDRTAPDPAQRGNHLRKASVNLKIIPCVTGHQRVAELVAYNLTDIKMHFHFSGPARLHLIPHINAPIADMPVLSVVEGRHFKADLTLPYGRIGHNYLARFPERISHDHP